MTAQKKEVTWDEFVSAMNDTGVTVLSSSWRPNKSKKMKIAVFDATGMSRSGDQHFMLKYSVITPGEVFETYNAEVALGCYNPKEEQKNA